MDTLVDIHSWLRWLVLAALVGGAGLGIAAGSQQRSWNARPFSIAVVTLDVQVTLGIVLWLFDSGWDQGLFIAAIHPVFMLAALGVGHVAMARARRDGTPRANTVAGVGLLISLVLVLLAIPWAR